MISNFQVNRFSSNDINRYLSGHADQLGNEMIQAIDIIMRHTASNCMIINGRNFFSPNQQGQDIGSGREVYFGYSQSTKLIQGNSGGTMALNIDTAVAAFMKQEKGIELTVSIFDPRNGYNEVADRRFWNDRNRKIMEQNIKGVQFIGTHLPDKNKTWRCNSLSRNGAAHQQFSITDEQGRTQRTTVADYYLYVFCHRLV